jgi:dTDP-4-dehydrorhamnose reductase
VTLLLTGASGRLGAYLLRQLQSSDIRVVPWSHSWTGALFGFPLQSVDLAQRDQVVRAFRQAQPRWIIHTAALSSVANCFRDPDLARAINRTSTELLAELAKDCGARLVLASTDLVFDGTKGNYGETDSPQPLSTYGWSKLGGEQVVLANPNAVVARLSLLYGPALVAERPGYFDQQIAGLRSGHPINCFVDEWRTPLSYQTAAQALVVLTRSEFQGLIHIGGPERWSRWEMGLQLARRLGARTELVRAIQRTEAPVPEPRPEDNSLDSTLWRRHFPNHRWPAFVEALQELGF